MDKSIKQLLGITDLNIEFDDTQPEQFHEEVIKGQTVTVWHFKLTYHRRCDQCGFTLNNNGTKLVRHVGPRSGFHFNYFEIRKQKYICANCGHTAIAEFNDVKPGDHIMRKVKQTAAMELSENVSQKHIAMDNNISTHTLCAKLMVYLATTKLISTTCQSILHSTISNQVNSQKVV